MCKLGFMEVFNLRPENPKAMKQKVNIFDNTIRNFDCRNTTSKIYRQIIETETNKMLQYTESYHKVVWKDNRKGKWPKDD